MRLIKTRLPVLARVHEEELLVRGHRPQVRRARGLDVVDDLAHVHHRLEAKHAAELRLLERVLGRVDLRDRGGAFLRALLEAGIELAPAPRKLTIENRPVAPDAAGETSPTD